jgi:hypothetical protein
MQVLNVIIGWADRAVVIGVNMMAPAGSGAMAASAAGDEPGPN